MKSIENMKRSVKITITAVTSVILLAAFIIAVPILTDLYKDYKNPAFEETMIFPDESRDNPVDTSFFVNGIEIKLIGIRGGRIRCEGFRDEIEIKDFYIGETEVTQELWTSVMGDNPSIHFDGDDMPVENVDLAECIEFVSKLDSLSGFGFAIPSYSHWLYAIHLGEGYCDNCLADKAWFEENSGGTTHPVKQKQPDALGLYDMLGNVAEWTISGSDPLFFTVGGSYESDKSHCSAGMREIAHGNVKLESLGLRLAMPAEYINN